MNLTKLYETQKILRDRIGYNEPDQFNKLILALLVELGECANEWRGFKFWSKDQNPRTSAKCEKCNDFGWYHVPVKGTNIFIGDKRTCDCVEHPKNPLLEEYVDGFHFVLELGLELGFEKAIPFLVDIKKPLDMYLKVYRITTAFWNVEGRSVKEIYYGELVSNYLALGKSLGFTWEEVEQAYYAKNKINHQRQSEGY